MTLYPFVKNTIVLNCSKKEFLKRLIDSTEKNFRLMKGFNEIAKVYCRDINGNKFTLHKTTPSTKFIDTVIHGEIIEKTEGVFLNYYIRFNIWSYFLMLVITSAVSYYIFDVISTSKQLNWGIIGIFFFAFFINIWNFNSDVKSDEEFIQSIIKNIC